MSSCMDAVYAVFFRLKEGKVVEVGALGEIMFESGIYVYVGSGGSNVFKRVERHFSQDKNCFWHVDYFSVEAEPLDYFILPESSSFECVLAGIAGAMGEPVEGFGSSDCGCGSHFFRLV